MAALAENSRPLTFTTSQKTWFMAETGVAIDLG